MKVVPVVMADLRLRVVGRGEFEGNQIPDDFKHMLVTNFEAFWKGKWRAVVSGFYSEGQGPMLWIEHEDKSSAGICGPRI